MSIPSVGLAVSRVPTLADQAVAGILTAAKIVAIVTAVSLLYTAPAPTLGFFASSMFTIYTAQENRNRTIEAAISAAYVIAALGLILAMATSGVATVFFVTAHVINLTSLAISLKTRATLWYQASLH